MSKRELAMMLVKMAEAENLVDVNLLQVECVLHQIRQLLSDTKSEAVRETILHAVLGLRRGVQVALYDSREKYEVKKGMFTT